MSRVGGGRVAGGCRRAPRVRGGRVAHTFHDRRLTRANQGNAARRRCPRYNLIHFEQCKINRKKYLRGWCDCGFSYAVPIRSLLSWFDVVGNIIDLHYPVEDPVPAPVEDPVPPPVEDFGVTIARLLAEGKIQPWQWW